MSNSIRTQIRLLTIVIVIGCIGQFFATMAGVYAIINLINQEGMK